MPQSRRRKPVDPSFLAYRKRLSSESHRRKPVDRSFLTFQH